MYTSYTGVSRAEACRLLAATDNELLGLFLEASKVRHARTGRVNSYSRKGFIRLTNLCRDQCAYRTFARHQGIDWRIR